MSKYLLTYGLDKQGQELAGMIEKRNAAVKFGNDPSAYDEEIFPMMSGIIMDPKKELLFSYLNGKTEKSETEKAQLEEIKAERDKFLADCKLNDLPAQLKELIGDYDYKVAKIMKKEDFGNKSERKFLPKNLTAFWNPAKINAENMPTSLIRAAVAKGSSEVTDRDYVVFNLVSVVYDEITKLLVEHKWEVSYYITPADKVEKEEIEDVDKLL